VNPYSPPGAEAYASTTDPRYGMTEAGVVPQGAIERLRETRPWVMFLSILAFIATAFIVMMAFFVGAMGLVADHGQNRAMALLALVYLPIGLVYVYPGIKLWTFGSAIGRLMRTRSTVDLEAALGEQKSFWKYCGIAVIVMFALYFAAAIGAAMYFTLNADRHTF
jgi:hypothetical protein